jgi:branched-chain amino acid transport system substrate-binding protein
MKLFSVFALVMTLLTTPVVAAENPATKPIVKIGVTIPLTGDVAYMGEGVRNAVTMALQALPPDTKYAYQVVFEDDGLEAKRAAASVNKMISSDKIDAVISFSSGTAGVVSPIAEQNKIVHFGIATSASIADGDYNFNHWTPTEEFARLMVAELQRRGIKKVAGIFMNQQGYMAVRDSFVRQIKGTDISLVTDKIVNPSERDFRGILAKAKAQNPEIYMIVFLTPQLEILTKQIKEAGITQPVTSIEAFGTSNEPSLFEGLWYVDSAEAKSSFYTQYRARFAKSPAAGAPNAYDIFNLIVYGYEHSNSEAKPSTAEVVKTLYSVKDFDGMLGKLSIDDKGVVFSPAAVKMIKDGKPVLLNEVENK